MDEHLDLCKETSKVCAFSKIGCPEEKVSLILILSLGLQDVFSAFLKQDCQFSSNYTTDISITIVGLCSVLQGAYQDSQF